MSAYFFMTVKELFSLSAQSSKRLAWMDYAKGIAIAMVAFRHVTIGIELSGLPIDPFVFEVIDNAGLTFRMPLFFLLSGIFFRMSVGKRSQGGYVLHKAKTILYPYLIWAFIITTLQILMSSHTNANADWHSYLDIFIHPWGHWWFLVALFNISVLYLALYVFTQGRHLLLLAVGLGMYYLAPQVQDFSILYHVLRLFIFFVAGDLISKPILDKQNEAVLASGKLLLLFLLLAVAGEWVLFQPAWRTNITLLLLFAVTGSCFTIWLSYRLAAQKHKYLGCIRTVGQHSLYVYLLHAPVGAAVRMAFVYGLGITNFWIILPVSFIACIFLPIVIYRICMQMGFWFLFSPTPPVKPTSLKTVNN